MGQLALFSGVADCSGMTLTDYQSIRGMQCNYSTLDGSSSGKDYDNIGHYAIPSRSVARFLGGRYSISREGSGASYYLSTRYPQPVVQFSCKTIDFGHGPGLNQTFLENTYFTFDPGQQHTNSLDSLFGVADVNLTKNSHKTFWLPPKDGQRHSILFAIFSWSQEHTVGWRDQPPRWTGNYRFVGKACGFDAQWHNATASRATNDHSPGIIVMDPLDWEAGPVGPGPIQINVTWAQRVSDLFHSHQPRYQNAISTAGYHAMLASVALSDIALEPNPRQLGTSAADGLTERQREAVHAAIEDGQLNQYDEDMTTTAWTSLDSLFCQQVRVQKPGYGYNSEDKTVKLSMAVITLYSLIAIIYLGITCISGRTSASWDSVGELLMLGLNSRPPTFLGRTSAGVSTLNTYRQHVRVMVNEDDGLELVFDEDRDNDKSLYRKMLVNTPY
jgi:hypothetical protein